MAFDFLLALLGRGSGAKVMVRFVDMGWQLACDA